MSVRRTLFKRRGSSAVLVAAGALPAPAAPTLTLTTGATDNTPGFDVTNVLSGDVVRMQYDTHSDFSAASSVTGTAGSGTISIVTGALADGLWYFRARIERTGYVASGWSNTVNETIDATAPTITSANSTSVAENATLAWSIVTDENATVVIGGTDAAQFELASNPSSTTRTLRWSSNGTRDFEAPADSGANNVYNITLTPTDAVGNVGGAQSFAVTVTDVADAWTPASLGANLIAWYKADTGVYSDAGTTLATNTQTVQQWNDQSGNGYHLKQATSGNRPQYLSGGFNSLPTVQFAAASNTFLSTTADSVVMGTGTTGSGFIVGQMLTGTGSFGRGLSYLGNGQSADENNAGSASFLLRFGTNDQVLIARNGNFSIASITLATNYRIGAIFDGANQNLYVNNGAATGTAADTESWTSPGAVLVGSRAGASWDGPISEIVVTNSALSAGDRTSLDDYFKAKWSL